MSGTIYADLRCLQDPAYRWRGIGYHTSALLRSRDRSRLSDWKTVGLTDSSMPTLHSEFTSLVDEISSEVNPWWSGERGVFIDGSPMTHDPGFTLRVQNRPGLIGAAVLYDFIPLDWPGYLPTVANRIEYLAKLARIRKFDLFFPISEYTAGRLSELAGVSRERIIVTGACVRRSLYEIRDRAVVSASVYDRSPPYFVTIGGDDKRKNTEIPLRAVRHLNLLYRRRIPLKVIGHYGEEYKRHLLGLAGHPEGEGFLEFCSYVSDEEVVSLHAGAIAAIAPSQIEGFSLPVAEAAVCGCPVIVSTCAAQTELVDQAEALFQPDDSAGLLAKLEALLRNPALRASLVASQAHLASRFSEDAVGDRFWRAIEQAVDDPRGAAVPSKSAKLHLAFLTPYPPDPSDAARYIAMTIRAGEGLFNSDVYTDAARPLTRDGRFSDAGAICLAPLLDKRYNGIVSVLGNSSSHRRILEVFKRYGGACILHDVRDVFPNDALLAARINRGSPLMVHTKAQQVVLKKRYGVDTHLLTSCSTVVLEEGEMTAAARRRVRERLDILSNTFVISSFCQVAQLNEIYTCIFALELLRNWNIPAHLYFIGDVGSHEDEVYRVADLYSVGSYIHCGDKFADEAAYRDFLIASDVAIQLQPYGFGLPPRALSNCIGAGLAIVANNDAAESCDAPTYVSTVPDIFSPLQVAEQLAPLWETRAERVSRSEERRAYLQTHNFAYYAKRLIEILAEV
jgi:glycosyltransferase involved in cell wall biosynthesis